MALTFTTNWEIDPVGGSDLNGAAFDNSGIVSIPDSTNANLSAIGGGLLSAGTYYLRFAYGDASSGKVGRLGPELSITVSANQAIQFTSPSAVSDATTYTVYASNVSGGSPKNVGATCTIGTTYNCGTTAGNTPAEGSCSGCGKIYNYGPDKAVVSFTGLSASGGTSTLQSVATPFTQNHVGNIIMTNFGVGLSFNGTTQALSIVSSASFNTQAAGGMTWVFWVKLASASPTGPMTVLSKTGGASGANIEYILYYDNAAQKYTWKVGDAGSVNNQVVAASVTTADTNWHMVAVRWNSTASTLNGVATKTLSISVDGGAWNDQVYTFANAAGTNSVNIARRNATTPDQYFSGSMDAVGCWVGRLLSNTEIASLYNSGSAYNFYNLPDTYYDNLASWWDFDDSTTNNGGRNDYTGNQFATGTNTLTATAGVDGTGIAGGHYRIISNNQGVVTLDRACAANTSASGGSGKIGGAKKNITVMTSVGYVGATADVGYGKAWMVGTYTISRIFPNVPGGTIFCQSANHKSHWSLEGYGTTRLDKTKATITVGSVSAPSVGVAIWANGGTPNLTGVYIKNIWFDGNSINNLCLTGTGAASATASLFFNCVFNNIAGATTYGSWPGTTLISNIGAFYQMNCRSCDFLNCGQGTQRTFGNGTAVIGHSYIYGGAAGGFLYSSTFQTVQFYNTIIDSPGTQVVNGTVAANTIFEDVVVYTSINNTFSVTSSDLFLKNVHVEGGGLMPYKVGNGPRTTMINCSAYVTSGSAHNVCGQTINMNFITCSASALNDPTGATEGHKDFGLNNVAGGGALLRGTGWGRIGAIGGALNSVNDSKDDVGPIQHPDSGGSGTGAFAYVF